MVAGLMLSMFVHLGASVLIIPCGLAILVVLLCLGRINLANASVAAFVSVALSARKLFAMADFMRQFPRDLYPLSCAESLSSSISLLLQGLFWPPAVEQVNEVIKNREFAFGADELNYHTGLVPLMILLVAAITVARQWMARVSFDCGQVW